MTLALSAFTSDAGNWSTGQGCRLEARRHGRGWLYRRTWGDAGRRPTRWLTTTDRGLAQIMALRAGRP